MKLVKNYINKAITERITPDKVYDCRTNQTPHPAVLLGGAEGHGDDGEEARQAVEQLNQARVEEGGAEGTAGPCCEATVPNTHSQGPPRARHGHGQRAERADEEFCNLGRGHRAGQD